MKGHGAMFSSHQTLWVLVPCRKGARGLRSWALIGEGLSISFLFLL